MGSKSKTLNDLLLHQLRDVHYAEKHGGKTFGKLAKAATAADLATLLSGLAQSAHDAVDTLETVFDGLDKKSQMVPCEAMQGLVEEAKELLHDFEDSEALDAGLIAAAQAMVSYAASRCDAMRVWSAKLGLPEMTAAMETLLAEKRRALAALDRLADATPAPEGEGVALLTLKTAALSGLG